MGVHDDADGGGGGDASFCVSSYDEDAAADDGPGAGAGDGACDVGVSATWARLSSQHHHRPNQHR